MKSTIKQDVAVLQEQVNEIKTNHLPHLKMAIDKVDDRTWWILGTLILGFIISITLTIWK